MRVALADVAADPGFLFSDQSQADLAGRLRVKFTGCGVRLCSFWRVPHHGAHDAGSVGLAASPFMRRDGRTDFADAGEIGGEIAVAGEGGVALERLAALDADGSERACHRDVLHASPCTVGPFFEGTECALSHDTAL